jgi:hypothetical protein
MLCAPIYLTIFFVDTEVHPFQARLPTSQLLRVMFERMRERLYVDEGAGTAVVESKIPPGANIIEDTTWTIVPPVGQGGVLSMPDALRDFQPSGPAGVSFRRIGDVPPRQLFMPIGHLLWALVFGYLGGRMGQFVYARRMEG